MKKRIKVIINTLYIIPGEVGGTEIYTVNLIKKMAVLYPYQLDLFVLTNRENYEFFAEMSKKYAVIKPINCSVRARNRLGRVIFEQLFISKILSRYEPDVIWSPGYVCPVFSPYTRITTVHDVQFKSFIKDFPLPAILYLNLFISLTVKRSKFILTGSSFAKGEILKYFNVNPDRIMITPYGVEPEFFHLQDVRDISSALFKYRISQPFLLCVSNTYPHKNVACALIAFKLLISRLSHMFVLVGNRGRGERELQSALMDIDPSRYIRLYYIPRKDLISLYHSANIFLFPSLYEGFGLPVLEGMASGIPVISTRSAAIPEVGGDFIWYVDPPRPDRFARAILEVLADENRDKIFRLKKAVERARSFTWERTADLTMEVIRSSVA